FDGYVVPGVRQRQGTGRRIEIGMPCDALSMDQPGHEVATLLVEGAQGPICLSESVHDPVRIDHDLESGASVGHDEIELVRVLSLFHLVRQQNSIGTLIGDEVLELRVVGPLEAPGDGASIGFGIEHVFLSIPRVEQGAGLRRRWWRRRRRRIVGRGGECHNAYEDRGYPRDYSSRGQAL